MIKETKKSPAIRFRGFDGKWIEEKYGKIFSEVKSGLSRSLDIEDIGIPVVRANNISDGNLDLFHDVRYWYDNDPKGADINNYLVEKNDILINFINSESRMGTAAFVDIVPFRKTIYTTNILRVRVNKGYDSKFVFYTTQQEQYKEYIHSITKTAINQASFTTVDLKKYKLSIPKYEEQKHISGLMTCVDNLITLHQRKLDQLKKLKKYFLQNMFPAKGEKVPRIRFKGFTGDWEQRKLSTLFEKFDDGDWIEAKNQSSAGFRLVQTGNVGVTEYIDKPDNKKWVSEDTFNKLHCEEIFSGDILISRLPEPAGRACIVPETGTRMITAVDCTIARTTAENSRDFLVQCLATPGYFKWVNTCLAGGTRQRISKSALANYEIMVPTIEEQTSIGVYFKTIDHLITLHQRKLDQLQTMKKFMLQNMFI